MVAHSYLKTPTALADEILSIYEDEDARLSSFMTRIRMAASGRLAVSDSALSMLRGRIRNAFALKIASMESALGLLHARISAADPRKLLERGFALALDSNGVRIKVADGVRAGDKVSVLFPDGTLKCTVDDVERE
jgi:exodeoxyribonuclease VII large subunit